MWPRYNQHLMRRYKYWTFHNRIATTIIGWEMELERSNGCNTVRNKWVVGSNGGSKGEGDYKEEERARKR